MQPSPSLENLAISESAKSIQEQLCEKIRNAIDHAGGQITFSEFVRYSLYSPSLGYYQNELQTFGELGDFVTAPELGQLFAAGIANSLGELLATESSYSLLEIGAGTGALAVELLNQLEAQDQLPKQYLILEPSASLQKLQKQHINQCTSAIRTKVEWITALPSHFEGIILANEVADAIPFERVSWVAGQWRRLGVSYDNAGFKDCLMDVIEPEVVNQQLDKLAATGELVEGYTTEYRPQLNGWIKSLDNCLESGAVLLFDYGYVASEYYHPQRASGTLNCFVRHHRHDDPFRFIGLQDITAHVDFSQLARTAVQGSLEVCGFTTQAAFLLENEVAQKAETLAINISEEQRFGLSQQMQKLLMPGQMGEVIKAILLTKSNQPNNSSFDAIKGFSLQDHLHRL